MGSKNSAFPSSILFRSFAVVTAGGVRTARNLFIIVLSPDAVSGRAAVADTSSIRETNRVAMIRISGRGGHLTLLDAYEREQGGHVESESDMCIHESS